MIERVPIATVDHYWPHLRSAFEAGCRKIGGDLASADLYRQCRTGESFLIVAHDGMNFQAASVWKAEPWGSTRKLRCVIIVGIGMMQWRDALHEEGKALARDCGATSIISEGRKGMAHLFPEAKIIRHVYEEPV